MASEFFLLASLVLVGIIFFSVFQTYTLTQSSETKKAEVRAEAERIASLAYKISKDPSNYLQYCLSTFLSNITIENGLLKYESGNYKFVLLIPSNIENSKLVETTKICLVKKDGKITFSSETEGCNFNRICEAEECKLNCPDCYGPNNLCINDNFCNPNIGENCRNSLDCSCKFFGLNYICCPENPSANKLGCLYLSDKKKKGQECYCDEECSSNLKCNPVDPSFTAYKKACCEEGRSWNGSECVENKPKQVYIVALVPAFYNDLNKFKERAEFIKSFTEQVLPFREKPGSLIILIGEEDCPMADEFDVSTLIKCGNELAQKKGYPNANIVGGILGKCVGTCKDDTGGFTVPGMGFFIHGFESCLDVGCPSTSDACVTPHEIGHNFKLCEGYCYAGRGCYEYERYKFGGYCGTSRVEQKFPYKRSAILDLPCGNCGPDFCCPGRILNNDPINSLDEGRDIMGGEVNIITNGRVKSLTEKRAFACDSYLAIKDVANRIYGFDLPEVTDEDIKKCYEHIKGDTYP
jgi:hypothetical protein